MAEENPVPQDSTPGNVNDLLSGLGDYLKDNIGSDLPGNLPPDFDLEQSKYDFTYRIFPNDLGEPGYNGHYMLININVSNYSSYENVTGPTVAAPGAGGTRGRIGTFNRLGSGGSNSIGQDISKVDALRANIDQQFRGGGRTLGPGGVFIPRQTRRIAESIALFMPNTMHFSQINQYEDISLTGILKNGLYSVLPGPLASFGRAGEAAAGLAQAPINPRVEVIFSNTALRQFQFDFLFAPANEAESASLDQIIRTLRFHAAPEVANFSGDGIAALKGLLWTPPSEFDITFYNRGQENRALPRINTCVLEQTDVDFAPSGVYATFRNGFPVKVRLQLRFREVEVLHKLRVLQGF